MAIMRLTLLALLILAPSSLHSATGRAEYLISRPAHKADAGEDEWSRRQRLSELSSAIGDAGGYREERAWLTMMALRESGLIGYVQRDEPPCRGAQSPCDHGKAWSMWQLHGTDRTGSTEDAAREAASRFRKCANYCLARGYDYWEGGTSLYATGTTCSWPEARARVEHMWRIYSRVSD